MANDLRFQVVGEAFKKKPLDVTAPSERPSEYFGKRVFNREKMYKYLSKDVYEKMVDVIDNGARLDRTVANAVAEGIMRWAKENGVTICIENLCLHDGTIHYGGFLYNPFITAKMVDELNAAAGAKVFGFCLDVGHSILAANDPKNFMLTLGDRIQCFHVHDNDKLTDQHLAPYMGKLDWDRFADGLREIRFNKTMSFETFHYARIMDSLGILEDGLKMLYKVGEAIQRKAAWEE